MCVCEGGGGGGNRDRQRKTGKHFNCSGNATLGEVGVTVGVCVERKREWEAEGEGGERGSCWSYSAISCQCVVTPTLAL